jgi:hypothetical protein
LLKLASTTPAAALVLGADAEEAIAQSISCTEPGCFDATKLMKRARSLWRAFLLGVRKAERDGRPAHGNEPAIPPFKLKEIDPQIFIKGMQLSSPFVVQNLECVCEENEDESDDTHIKDETHKCAVACGMEAAFRAQQHNGGKLDRTVFGHAWTAVQASHGSMTCRAELICKNGPAPASVEKAWAFGC